MVAALIVFCVFFCPALNGCSNSSKKPVSDLCTFKLGARGTLMLDWGESATCEVDPNEERTKALHNLQTHKGDDMGGTVGLKGTWMF